LAQWHQASTQKTFETAHGVWADSQHVSFTQLLPCLRKLFKHKDCQQWLFKSRDKSTCSDSSYQATLKRYLLLPFSIHSLP